MKDTAAALNLVVSNKLQAAQPKTVPKQPGAPTFIKYTPSQQGPQYASGSRERTIKMQDMPVDPMEPPKFRHKKVCLRCMHCLSMFAAMSPSLWQMYLQILKLCSCQYPSFMSLAISSALDRHRCQCFQWFQCNKLMSHSTIVCLLLLTKSLKAASTTVLGTLWTYPSLTGVQLLRPDLYVEPNVVLMLV